MVFIWNLMVSFWTLMVPSWTQAGGMGFPRALRARDGGVGTGRGKGGGGLHPMFGSLGTGAGHLARCS